MDPNNTNNLLQTQGGYELSTSGSMDAAGALSSAGNNGILFSTLRHLAARNSESSVASNGLYNETTSFSSFPVSLSDQSTNANNFSSNAVPSTGSTAWLDQAKLSLLPMYGMFQSSLNSSEMCRNNNLSWVDSNIQQAAVAAVAFNAAASLNATMHNLPSLGHLNASSVGFANLNDGFQQQRNDLKFGSPSNESMKNSVQSPQGIVGLQRQTTSSTYSQSTASTSHTPQPAVAPSVQSQANAALTPIEGHSVVKIDPPNVSASMEELSELDLHYFEDFFMEKPSTSQQPVHSQQSHFFTSVELDKINTVESVNQPIQYRADELASADIELDRLVSLVASQNNGDQTASHNQPFAKSNLKESNTNSNSLSDLPIFELPQFTPPDSPSVSPSNSQLLNIGVETNHFASSANNLISVPKTLVNVKNCTIENKKPIRDRLPTETSLVLIPKEIKAETTNAHHTRNKLALPRRDVNKLPVYKQSACSLLQLNRTTTFQPQLDNEQNRKRIDDAYSFEEDEMSAASCTLTEVLQGTKSLSEGREQKIEKDEEHQSKTKRKNAKQHSSTETVPCAKNIEKTNTVHAILAERTKRRARALFVSSEIAGDDHSVLTDIPIPTCTMRSSTSTEDACLNTPLLPKLVIRLPKRENSANEEQTTPKHSNTKEKKRKKKERDVDWTETEEWHGARPKDKHRKERRHKKCHHKRRKHSTEADESARAALPCSMPFDHLNHHEVSDEAASIASPFRTESENSAECFARLHLFERPTERPRRGTFLLPKEDIFTSDCALWRIDNQNLLQKYLPIVLDGVLCYQNSSTYSGWCEHYVDSYIAIKVEYIKQSRSENIVRPIFPLQDLFPATNFLAADDEDRLERKTSVGEFEWNCCLNTADQQFRGYLNNFAKMMLKQAVSPQFVQNVRQNNDWSYLCALTEIESISNRCLQNIRRKEPHWSSKFVDCLQLYPRINALKRLDDCFGWNRCQACSSEDNEVSSAIQLFGLDEQYNHETLSPITSSKCSAVTHPILATDFYVCAQCEHFAISYHKAFHLCFHILKSAEEKLELFSAKYSNISINELILKCLDDKMWLNQIADVVMCVSKDGMSDK